MRKHYLLILSFICFIISCGQQELPEKQNLNSLHGNITISGAFALYPLTVKWADEYTKIHPDVTIDISAGGAGKGMVDVLSGMVDIAMFSRELKPVEIEKNAWKISVAKDAVVATVNSKNPLVNKIKTCGLSQQQLSDIFLKNKYTYWGEVYNTTDKSAITVFTRSDACGAGEMWGNFFGETQENLVGIQVFGDPGIASAVKNDINSIGYNNVGYAYDIRNRKFIEGIQVIPIDLNNNGKIDISENFYDSLDSLNLSIRNGIYPQPPARDLYFITKGKPKNRIVLAFLNWVLGDGQKYIDEAGYVKLTEEKIKRELDNLNK